MKKFHCVEYHSTKTNLLVEFLNRRVACQGNFGSIGLSSFARLHLELGTEVMALPSSSSVPDCEPSETTFDVDSVDSTQVV